MDRLQSWFDGSDLVLVVLPLFSVSMSGLVLWRQSRTDRAHVDLLRRLAEIEEARRTEEVARTTEADVRASLRKEWSDSFGGWDTVLDMANRGDATARNVNLESLRPRSSGSEVIMTEKDAFFPVPEMVPGHRVSCDVFFSMHSGRSYEAVVTWDGPRGPQRRTIPLAR